MEGGKESYWAHWSYSGSKKPHRALNGTKGTLRGGKARCMGKLWAIGDHMGQNGPYGPHMGTNVTRGILEGIRALMW